MFFLVRLVFWLAVVFAFLPWPEGSGLKQAAAYLRGGAGAAGAGALSALSAEAERRALEACAQSPGACLEATARFAAAAHAMARGASKPEEKPPAERAPAERSQDERAQSEPAQGGGRAHDAKEAASLAAPKPAQAHAKTLAARQAGERPAP